MIPGLLASVGGFYFKHPNVKTTAGPDVGVDYSLNAGEHRLLGLFSRITVGVHYRHDKVRGNNVLLGLTGTIALGEQAPLSLLAEHMVDHPRRDIDMVVQSAAESQRHILRKGDGSAVNVREVSNKQEFDQAMGDKHADVIAVNGKISGIDATGDGLIDRSVYLTGGRYDFNGMGQHFDMSVAHQGQLTAASGKDLLRVNGTTVQATIRDLGLNVDAGSTQAAVSNTDGSTDYAFKRVRLDNISTNGAVNFTLGANQTSHVSVVNSHITTKGQSAVTFGAKDDSHLIIDAFDHNSIDVSGRNNYGVFNHNIGSNSRISYTGGFNDNTIMAAGTIVFGVYNDNTGSNSSISYAGGFNDNTITTTGTYAHGVYNLNNSSHSSITYTGGFSNNSINVSGLRNYGVFNHNAGSNSSISYAGGFNDNTITTAGDAADAVYNYNTGSNSSISYAGGFNDNTITTYGARAGAVVNNNIATDTHIVYQGFSGNHITVQGQQSVGFYVEDGNQGSTVEVNNFNHNIIHSAKSDAISLNGRDTITINTGSGVDLLTSSNQLSAGLGHKKVAIASGTKVIIKK